MEKSVSGINSRIPRREVDEAVRNKILCKKIYRIPGFVMTKPSWDWDGVNYSRPGRVL